MDHVTINYSLGKNISFTLIDYVLFMGDNKSFKNRIIYALDKLSKSRRLTESEIDYFGETGPTIEIRGKAIKSTEYNIFVLKDRRDLLEQLEYKKNSMLERQLNNYQTNYDINVVLEEINDHIFRLETVLQEYLQLDELNLSLEMQPLLLRNILKLGVAIQKENLDFTLSLEHLDNSHIIDLFIKLLRTECEQEAQKNLILVDNDSRWLNNREFGHFVRSLLEISRDTGMIKLFVFSEQIDLGQWHPDISKTVLLYEGYQQMPELDIFYNSIQRHYPDQLMESQEQIERRLFFIAPFIGRQLNDYEQLSERNMILLYILKGLLGDSSSIETSTDRLSPLEKAFLER